MLAAASALALSACSDSGNPNAASSTTDSSSTTVAGSSTTTSNGNGDRNPSTRQGAAQAIDPSYFADGSCIRYRPTSGNRHITVFLDAGHGGTDPGAVGTTELGKTIYEADVTLPVELGTMALLRAKGFTVVVSRTRSTTVLRLQRGDLDGKVLSLVGAHDEIAARDICANDAHANLLVGIYFDASNSSSAAGSVTTYDAVRPFSRENMRFAQLLQSSVVAAMNHRGWQIPDVGVLDDVGMGSNNGDPATSVLAAQALEYDHLMLLGPAMKGYFSTPSKMPGALIEPLFITDPFEGSIAANAKDQRDIASGIAHAVELYFSPGT
jgi:N-acetylmuramoyl-L-alanine amidase